MKKRTTKPILPSVKNKINKSVRIERVDNGFIVKQTIDTGKDYKERTMIAKEEKEAKELASKML